ncbi:acetate/propionate family kinase [Algoriphagus boritolerans]|uniref:Acetate kinase n=1 Tax=Algoriphagus boritolerans DSM 17298 = JCM 18970 TaxID=1120964 RepID=A0A1H5S7R4_9BACT|nr:acetate kinase [Algoriphagus boritolerans]SEF45831.1 acetate kinase [Algoriphagus boritolerans DSM 17298 = JCM 18970]
MNIFVINSGSSSIKYQLISMPEAKVICVGMVDRIGLEGAKIEYKAFLPSGEVSLTETKRIPDHASGLNAVAELLTDPKVGVISNPDQVHIVGHRVVHGGEQFSKTQLITKEAKAKIKELFPLAPLHNPANYLGIEVAETIFTNANQVAVFDTAFHQTMPEVAYRMAIPNEFYEKHGIRAYGFHGTSHKYVSEQAIDYLGKADSKIITVHLGNGCSMAAIKDGKCMDSSMGLGPMNGLIMGTRAGDLDQSVIFHLVNQLGYSLDEVNTILNKKSGMLGLTGFSDMRDIRKLYDEGDKTAILAYAMYAYRIRKYIGAFAAAMNGLDVLVFTAGVGENDRLTRKLVCQDMDFLGIRLNESKNEIHQKSLHEIHSSDSPVKVLVIPTNEELEIAMQCFELIG